MNPKQYVRAAALGFCVVTAMGAALLFTTPDSARAQQEKSKQEPAKQQTPPKPAPKPGKEEDSQTIRLGTQLVNVLFSVTDKQNHYLNDLTQEDVAILEDGKAQQIFTFKRET